MKNILKYRNKETFRGCQSGRNQLTVSWERRNPFLPAPFTGDRAPGWGRSSRRDAPSGARPAPLRSAPRCLALSCFVLLCPALSCSVLLCPGVRSPRVLLAGRAPEGTGGLGPGACGDGPREGAAPGGSAGLGGAAGLSRAPAATWCRYRDPRAAPPRRLPPGSAACCRQRSFPGRPQQRGPKALQVCKPRSRRRSAGLAGLINGIHRETNCLLFSLPSRCPPAGAGGGGAVRARSGLHPAVPSGGGAAPFKPRQRHLSSKGQFPQTAPFSQHCSFLIQAEGKLQRPFRSPLLQFVFQHLCSTTRCGALPARSLLLTCFRSFQTNVYLLRETFLTNRAGGRETLTPNSLESRCTGTSTPAAYA
ncbi:uncharacterized protein [Anas acuta]|uniref:uncharacterized protein n=1 Tax=Anas acuta TaxID=28680 RepID=UPI0035C8FC59